MMLSPSHRLSRCIFCLIVKGTIPSFKVYETEHMLAFLDIAPVSHGHTQIIPKYHARTILELPDEYLAEVGPIAKKVALATGAEQFNVLQNNGKMAFQHVDYVHFHVIPKPTPEEGLILSEDKWPQKSPTKEELAVQLEAMKGKL
ncbi:HIT-like domain-containing protein [Amylostereum chailletii]|nr:HIT-like domain-containing protein [Amylostereum chailletii]